MTAAVTRNLALLSAAPGGIKALRQLIFDLAIAGSLLPQQGSDQPAEAVLIATAAMRPSTAARRSGNVRNCARAEGLPSGWVATTVGEVLICRDGERIPVSQADRETRAKVYDYYGASGVIDKIDGFLFDKPLLLVSEDGANLINRSTPIAFIAQGRYWVNNHAHVLDGIDEGLLRYMALYFNAIDLKPYVTGTAQPKLNQAKLNAIPVSLPPQAEQHRIVAKVDELMVLCDRLEARQQDAEAAHARLVQALLDSLTQARDAEEFQACWQRLAGQFQALLTTDDSLERLEAVVLQLAVTGRLTGQGKPFETQPDDAQDLLPLATGWAYRTFNDLIDPERPIAYGVLVPGPEVAGGVPFVRIADLSLQSPANLPEKTIAHDVDAKFSRTRLVGGEILMGVVGSVGKLGIAPASWAGANIARAVCRIVPAQGVNRDYVLLLLRSDLMRRQFLGDTRTLAQPTLNVGLIRAAKAPVPPLAEQARIVAKVTELLALCDQLKARIAAARAKHAQLAEALVAQAVAA